MTSRRNVLRGAAGLGAAVVGSANAAQAPSIALPQQMMATRSLGPDKYPSSNAEYLARNLFRQQAHAAAEREQERLTREMECVSRINSMSQAAKNYYLRKLSREEQQVWTRLNEWTSGI